MHDFKIYRCDNNNYRNSGYRLVFYLKHDVNPKISSLFNAGKALKHAYKDKVFKGE
jgi:hypothetical protein